MQVQVASEYKNTGNLQPATCHLPLATCHLELVTSRETAEIPTDSLAAQTHEIHQEKEDQIGIAPGDVGGEDAGEPFG